MARRCDGRVAMATGMVSGTGAAMVLGPAADGAAVDAADTAV